MKRQGTSKARPNPLEVAETQLVQAILKNQGQLAQKLADARQDLELSLKHVPLEELSEEIREEVGKLAKLLGARSVGSDQPSSSNTKTTAKLEFIKRELEKRDGRMLKTELLELAALEFNCTPAPTYLDAAIKLGKLKRIREGYNAVVTYQKPKRQKDEE